MDVTECHAMLHSQFVMQLVPLTHEGVTKSVRKTHSSMEHGPSFSGMF